MTSLSRLAFRLIQPRRVASASLALFPRDYAGILRAGGNVEAGRWVPKVLWCPLCLPRANQKATEKCVSRWQRRRRRLKSEREGKKSPFSRGVDPCNCFQTQLSRGILPGHHLSQNLLLLRPTNYRLPYPLNLIANYCYLYERKLEI